MLHPDHHPTVYAGNNVKSANDQSMYVYTVLCSANLIGAWTQLLIARPANFYHW